MFVARPRGRERHAHAPAGAREARRHEPGALFVRRDDEGHRRPVFLVVAEHGVKDGQDGAAAVAENRLHALVGQHLHQHVRTRHAGAGQRVSHAV